MFRFVVCHRHCVETNKIGDLLLNNVATAFLQKSGIKTKKKNSLKSIYIYGSAASNEYMIQQLTAHLE